MLITEDARDRGINEQAILPPITVDLRRGLDFGEHRHGNPEDLAYVLTPLKCTDIHEHRARGVGDVGAVHTAIDPARQIPQNPAVGVAEEEVPGLGTLTCSLNIVEDPLNL